MRLPSPTSPKTSASPRRALGEFGARPVQSDRPARRHRPVGRGQDRLHHRAGASAAAWRAAAGVRGAVERTHRARAARAAARRRGAALRLRDASARADRRAALAGVDQPHQRASARHRVPVGARQRHRTLTLDIVDYPGEWLLDLPLLATSYAQWSADTLQAVARRARAPCLRRRWHRHLATLDPSAPENEQAALQAAQLFTEYLQGLPRRALSRCGCCRPAAS